MIIILLGPPGAGKGTIAKRLEAKLGIPHISMGHLLRSEAEKGSEIGKQLEPIIEKGNLVPSELAHKILEKRLEKARKGYILDGFPRDMEQVRSFEQYLKKTEQEIDLIVFLDVPKEVSIERLTSRQSCQNCGAIFNTNTKSPKMTGICDDCGKALSAREDDNKKAIETRLEIFEDEAMEVIEFYKTNRQLITIDGQNPVRKVLDKILDVFKVPE
jgi:adenylate kinase